MDQIFSEQNSKKQWARFAAMSTVVRARVAQVDGPAIRSQSAGRKRSTTGHMNKDKKAKHTDVKETVVILKKEQIKSKKDETLCY